MKTALVVFPGSNCDRDASVAIEQVTGHAPVRVWHEEHSLPAGTDFVMVPGGFSYGDYLRCGAMAAQSPICQALKTHSERGGYILGVCNGFQVLCETRILPGALIRNSSLNFVCKSQNLEIAQASSVFTKRFERKSGISFPIAHHDGNFVAEEDALRRIEAEGQVAFRYPHGDNPNGSLNNIAGILSENGRVLGMMPHPERAMGKQEGGSDGVIFFEGLLNAA